jgi:hypothetical protein
MTPFPRDPIPMTPFPRLLARHDKPDLFLVPTQERRNEEYYELSIDTPVYFTLYFFTLKEIVKSYQTAEP